jgi:hypothetical protein
MYNLRPHHLLCICLFDGRGYSDGFIRNLRDIRDRLISTTGTYFRLAEGHDDICSACPNLTARKTCASGDADARRKDGRLTKTLGLQYGRTYAFTDTVERMRAKMTREHFYACCGNCRWRMEGLCSYDRLMERLPLFERWQ